MRTEHRVTHRVTDRVPARDPRGPTFQQLMVGLLFGAIALVAGLMPADADTFWHLRAGEEIWRTLRVPLEDHYSFTAAGRFWPNHEWLWQAISYALYRVGGFPLLVAGAAAMATGAYAIVYRLMVGPTATRFVLMLLGLSLAALAWAPRPQILSLLLQALLLWLLVTERYRWLPLLFVVWANAHGAVAMGGVVLAAAAVVAVARARRGDARDRRRARTLALLVPVCAAATALTPLGFRLWGFIGASLALSRNNDISEWRPTWPVGPIQIAFWVLALGFAGLLVWRRRRLRGAPWGDLVLVAAALVTLPLAFRAVRNTSAFLLVAIPAASRLLGSGFRFGAERPRPAPSEFPRANLALLVGVSLCELLVLVAAWSAPIPRLGWRPIDDGALAAVRACPAQLYNRYAEGGYLIWYVRDKRVFIDSRQDPYPQEFMQELRALARGAPHRELFARYGIRCAFLPAASKMVGELDSEGWRTSFRDAEWSVLTAP